MDKKAKVVKFLLIFISVLTAEYIFLYFLPVGFETTQRQATATILGFILSLLGLEVAVSGDLIQLSSGALRIVYECTGGFAFFIFSSAVFAYPSSWMKKIVGQIFGLLSVFVLNIIRLVVISLILIASPRLFDFIHKYLWQVTFPVVVIFLFIFWVEKWGGE